MSEEGITAKITKAITTPIFKPARCYETRPPITITCKICHHDTNITLSIDVSTKHYCYKCERCHRVFLI